MLGILGLLEADMGTLKCNFIKQVKIGALGKDFHGENKQLVLVCLALGRTTLGNFKETMLGRKEFQKMK